MGKLISVNVWAKNSSGAYTSASPNAIQEDRIKFATNASLAQKQAFPSASSNINTIINANFLENNQGTDSIWYVSDALATLVSGS